MSRFAHLPPSVRRLFTAHHRRLRKLQAGRWALRLVSLYLLLVLAAVHLDRFARLGESGRVAAYVAVHAALVVLGLVAFVRMLRAFRPPPELAYHVEAGLPAADEEIVAADALLHPSRALAGDSQRMKSLLAQRAEERARQVERPPLPDDPSARVRRFLLFGLLGLCVVLTAFPAYEFPLMLRRFYQPRVPLPRPSFTKIVVGAFPNPAGAGSDVTVPVTLRGRLASSAWIVTETPAGRKQRERMVRIARDSFLHTFYGLREDRRFVVRAGDAESPPHRLRVVEQPRVEDLAVRVVPPAYTGLDPAVHRDPAEVPVLHGSSVEVTFGCGQELALAEVVVVPADDPERRESLVLADGRGSWRLDTVEQPLAFRLRLRNQEGFENLDQDERRLTVVEDQPPRLKLAGGRETAAMFPAEERVFDLEVEDDLGLKSISLNFLVNPDPDVPVEPRRQALRSYPEPALAMREAVPISLESLQVVPGDVVEVRAEAMDTHRSYGRSNRLLIRVISFDPGLEEQKRLETLRVLQEALAEEAAVRPAPERGRLGLPEESASRLDDLAQAKGVEPLPLAGPAVELLQRVQDEQDLTPFYAYKHDLRLLTAAAGRVLLTDAAPEDRGAVLESLAGEFLPAHVQYRFFRNLLRALGAFRAEAERLGQPQEDSEEDRLAKRADQLRRALERWMGYLADMARASDRAETSFAVFEADIQAVNTAAYRIEPGTSGHAAKVVEAVNALMVKAQESLPMLLDELTAARRALQSTCQKQLDAWVANFSAGDRPLRRAYARLLVRSCLHDPAVPPERCLGPELLRRLTLDDTPAPEERERCRTWLTALDGYLVAAEAQARERQLEALLEAVDANPSLGPWNRAYDREHYRIEHQQFLDRARATGGLGPRPEAGRSRQERPANDHAPGVLRPPFIARVESTGAATTDALPQTVTSFCEAQERLAEELAGLERMLAGHVPPSTREERRRLLDAYSEVEARAEALLGLWRLHVGADGFLSDGLGPAERTGWLRALVRLQERLEHFREASRETVEVLRSFHGLDLDVKETALFPSRLRLLAGASQGLARVAKRLRAWLADGALDQDFFAEAARRLPVTAELERLAGQVEQLKLAARENADERRQLVHDILASEPHLAGDLIVRLIGDPIRELHTHLRKLADQAREAETAASAQTLFHAAMAGRKRLQDVLEDLKDLPEPATAPYAGPLRDGLARLTALEGTADGANTGRARLAFALSESTERVGQTRDLLDRHLPELSIMPHRPSADLSARAHSAARQQFINAIRIWRLAAGERMLAGLDNEDGSALEKAADAWQRALALRLSPVMLKDTRAALVGSGGREVRERKLWLVKEFQESRRLPLPRRHRTQTRTYFERLESAFREHEHTR